MSQALNTKNLIAICAALTGLMIATTEMRISKIIDRDAANYVNVSFIVLHFAAAVLLVWTTRSLAATAYLLATVFGFVLGGAGTPFAAIWTFMKIYVF